jgi:hypothetical protein
VRNCIIEFRKVGEAFKMVIPSQADGINIVGRV